MGPNAIANVKGIEIPPAPVAKPAVAPKKEAPVSIFSK